MTSSQYKGWRVFCPVTSTTTAPVYGNVADNTATALNLDQWWTAADGVGGTPGSTFGYSIMPTCAPRFMGLTTDTTTITGTETSLTSEILPAANNGCARAKATYAHTATQATYTMQVVFSVTGSVTAIHRMGLFTAATVASGGGIMVFITNLNQDATVGNGDTLTVTDTITLSG